MAEDKNLAREVEREVARQIGSSGDGKLDRLKIVNKFDKRASRATIYRMINRMLDEAPAAQKAIRKSGRARRLREDQKEAIKAAAEAGDESSSEAVAAELEKHLPAVVKPEDIVTGHELLRAEDMIRACIKNAEDVIAFCRAEGGKVRNPRLLLVASEHMRRTVETWAKIAEVINAAGRAEQFNQAVIAVIQRASPELAQQLINDLSALSAQWGA